MAIAGKERDNGVYEFSPYMIKPPDKTKWEAVKTAIWDPSTKEFLGRTATSWAKITLFYIIFYIALAILFAICMAGVLATIKDEKPSYTTDHSLIGTNPGLGFRPMSDTSEGALIWYNSSNFTTGEKYKKVLDTFFGEYVNLTRAGESKLRTNCDAVNASSKDAHKACPVELNSFQECSAPFYGYNTTSPCIFLKLNRIYDWIPKTYDTVESFPSDMPNKTREELKEHIGKGKHIWVSCEGEYSADKEHASKFTYYPVQGFPAYYYPFKHKKNEYLSPLVAVQIQHPKPGVLINIECRAWAKNIEYHGGTMEQRMGSVHFEIMRDTTPCEGEQTPSWCKQTLTNSIKAVEDTHVEAKPAEGTTTAGPNKL